MTDQDLWFQELYGAYINFSWSEPHSSPQPQKGFCFHSRVTELCPQRPCVLEEGRSVLEAGLSYPWAVKEQPVSLLHV